MINYSNRYIILLVLLAGIAFSSCKDQWEEHTGITDPALAENLLQEINKNPDLSKFSEYLVKTGYDKVIASSKTFTIWAPTNAALQNVDQSIISDTAKLKQFVGNHISNQSYLTSMPKPSLRIKTLNGKNIVFTKTSAEDAGIITADQYVGNGIIHIIDQAIIPKMNAWEYLNTSAAGALQKAELLSLKFMDFDTAKAEQTGIDPATGRPIYKPGTGLVERNRFLNKADISNEDSLLTYIVLTDAAFTEEENRLKQYFMVSTADSTDSITRWNVIKDLAFNGVYTVDNLPDTMYSANDSVKVHLDKSAIVETHRVSNGIVYVVNSINYRMDTKIKPVIIQGEYFFNRLDNTKVYSIRTRQNPITNLIFRDIYIANHGMSSYWINYLTIANSVKYRVYWVALNDFQTATFQMKVAFKSPAATEFAYKVVSLNNFSEVYLGDYTVNNYGLLSLYLLGDNVTTNGVNTLVLDYIKLVPILN